MSDHSALKPLDALLVLIGIVLALCGYFGLGYLLSIKPLFAGILIVFYWYAIKAGASRALPGALVGGLGGILNAALFVLPGVAPGMSALAGLVVVLVALYALLAGRWPLLFNQCYMLLATVGTIPAVLAKPDVPGMLSAVVLSTVYFGAVSWLARMLIERRARSRSK